MSTITGVRLTPVNVPRSSGLVCGHVIVEILTAEGLTGLGEMSDFQHLPQFHPDIPELERTLNGLLAGSSSGATTELEARLEAAFPQAGNLYDKGSVIKCGVDIALWDLRGKELGLSVSDLLGGAVRPALPVAYPIFRQQSESDIEVNLGIIATRLAEGFSLFRVYVGREPALDERFLIACRERFGDDIRIKSLDFSNLLDSRVALRFIDRTREVGFELVEAPAKVGDIEGLAFVRDRGPVPVSEHVYDGRWALDLVAARAVDVLNVGLFALGGITPARRILAVAEAAGLACLIGTTQELAIGTAAAAHVGVAARTATVAADPVGPLLYTTDVVAESVEYVGGELLAPAGPGLGMELDPARLEAARGQLAWAGSGVNTIIDRTGSAT